MAGDKDEQPPFGGEGSPSQSAGYGSVTCDGKITAKMTWGPPSTLFPSADKPPKVIVEERVYVRWGGQDGTLSHDLTGVVNTTTTSTLLSGRTIARALTVIPNPPDIIERACTPKAYAHLSKGYNPGLPNAPPAAANVSVGYSARVITPWASGTNCGYTFRLPEGFDGTLGHVTVMLNADSRMTIYDGATLSGSSGPKYCRWDSTHFADGTVVKFKTKATNTDGKEFTDEDWFIVYNQGSVRCVTEFEDGPYGLPVLSDVKGSLTAMKHTIAGASNGFSKSDFLSDCHKATAFYISAHGQTDGFYPDLTNDGDTNNGGALTSRYYHAIISNRCRPDVNVVFLSACSAGEFANPPLTSGFGIRSNSTDKAFCGFNDLGYIAGMQVAAKVFWSELAKGATAGEARVLCDAAYQTKRDDDKFTLGADAKCIIYGDSATKLHGVYGSTGEQKLDLFTIGGN